MELDMFQNFGHCRVSTRAVSAAADTAIALQASECRCRPRLSSLASDRHRTCNPPPDARTNQRTRLAPDRQHRLGLCSCSGLLTPSTHGRLRVRPRAPEQQQEGNRHVDQEQTLPYRLRHRCHHPARRQPAQWRRQRRGEDPLAGAAGLPLPPDRPDHAGQAPFRIAQGRLGRRHPAALLRAGRTGAAVRDHGCGEQRQVPGRLHLDRLRPGHHSGPAAVLRRAVQHGAAGAPGLVLPGRWQEAAGGDLRRAQYPPDAVQHHRPGGRRLVRQAHREAGRLRRPAHPLRRHRRQGAGKARRLGDHGAGRRDLPGAGAQDHRRHRVLAAGGGQDAGPGPDHQELHHARLASDADHLAPAGEQGRLGQARAGKPRTHRDGLRIGHPQGLCRKRVGPADRAA